MGASGGTDIKRGPFWRGLGSKDPTQIGGFAQGFNDFVGQAFIELAWMVLILWSEVE